METRLVNVNEVAERLNCGVRTVWRMRDTGRMPQCVNIGRIVRWRSSDITAWIEAGCPDVRKSGWKSSAHEGHSGRPGVS